MTDPLQRILDHVQDGDEIDDDVVYVFHRLLEQSSNSGELSLTESMLSRSFAAYQARKQAEESSFNEKVATFKNRLSEIKVEHASAWLVKMTTQSGISPDVLQELYNRLQADVETLPLSVTEWIEWLIEWLKVTPAAVEFCFSYSLNKVLKAVGRRASDILSDSDFDILHRGLLAWISGNPLSVIDQILNGTDTKCTRARTLATSVAPQSFSFFLNIVAQVTIILCEDLGVTYQKPAVLECLSTAVKKGFDSPEKVAYAALNQGLFLSRVEAHQGFNTRFPNIPGTRDGIAYKAVQSAISDMIT